MATATSTGLYRTEKNFARGPRVCQGAGGEPLTHGDRKSFPAQVSEAVGLPKKNSAICAGAADHWRSPWDATGLPAAVSSGDGEMGPASARSATAGESQS